MRRIKGGILGVTSFIRVFYVTGTVLEFDTGVDEEEREKKTPENILIFMPLNGQASPSLCQKSSQVQVRGCSRSVCSQSGS